jgi:short-subunit dehydrogenase
MRPVTLLTGASAGIGMALAHQFANHGHELVLVARREQRLNALADVIAGNGHARPTVVATDLQSPEAGPRIAAALTERGLEPSVVVNNAGFGLIGLAADLDIAEQRDMIDLNVSALTDLSLRFLESLERHKGGILNVASVAGFVPGPRSAVYYATKAYVLSFTEAMHQELAPRGIRVCALCPGPVPSEFQARAGAPPRTLDQGGMFVLSAEEVARQGYSGFMEGHRVVVPGWRNRLVTVASRLVPRRFLLKAAERRQVQRTSA